MTEHGPDLARATRIRADVLTWAARCRAKGMSRSAALTHAWSLRSWCAALLVQDNARRARAAAPWEGACIGPSPRCGCDACRGGLALRGRAASNARANMNVGGYGR